MAKQMKKALCVILAVIMAVGCFAVSGFAYTGYDHNGSNSSLKVQTVVTMDKTSYAVGDTVNATITLNHINDSVIGFEGVVAYDSSVLEYQSATLGTGFEYYSADFTPASVAVDTSNLLMGYGGSAVTAANLYKMMGTSTFGALSAVPVKVENLTGLEAGSGDTVITLQFKANAAVTESQISLIPSVIYSSAYGYYTCAATTSTDGAYATSYSAIKTSASFEITGGSAPVKYDITFTWHDGSTVVSTVEGATPAAPEVAGYSDGDYDYSFSAWSPSIAAATAAATYVAQYTSSFVSADYTAYTSAVSAATAKRDNGTSWTAASLKTLNDALAADVSGLGRTSQSTVDAAVLAINNAADALQAEAAVYDITFTWNGGSQVVKTTAGEIPVAPSVAGYEDDAKTYTFKGWDKELTAATGATTYTAQYNETYKDYTIIFNWNNGGTSTVKCHWGDTPVAPTVPGYSEGGKSYSFSGWNPTLVACAGNATYTAQYSSEDIYYNITFIINGVSSTDQIKAGATPVAPDVSGYSDGDYDYTFTGWDKAIVAASADTTYTAQFSSEFVSADYTAVNAAIAQANALDLSTYTEASVAVLNTALTNVTTGLGRTQQTTVSGYASAITDAISKLVSKGADYSKYNQAVTALQAKLAQTDVYTPSSISTVAASLKTIDDALSKTLDVSEQATVDKALSDVTALDSQLVAQADKTALNTAYSKAQAVDQSAYTPSSVKTLTDAMAAAKTVIDDKEATETQISAQVTALNNAIDALVAKADKTALAALILKASSLTASDYEDFSAVTSALAAANNVNDDADATAAQVSQAATTLSNAIDGLKLKSADYTAWNTLVGQFKAIDTTLYTAASVKAVNDIIAQVQADQPITYQDTLDTLTSNLDTAIKALVFITQWSGEKDWNGIDHEYFSSNLEFVQKVDEKDPSNITIEVYLNHPNDIVSGIQLAMLFDSAAMTFNSATINNGTQIYATTGTAGFDVTQYGLASMGTASVLKVAADYTTALPKAAGQRDLLMTLSFTATGSSDSTYVKAVPLASNTTADKSVYSALLDENSDEQFMHNDAASIALAKVEGGTVSGSVTVDNALADVTYVLTDGTHTYNKTTKGDSDFSFTGVQAGTYTLTLTSEGSLGFTVENIVVSASNTVSLDPIQLLYGDANKDEIISVVDISTILVSYNSYALASDVNGDGVISVADISMVLVDIRYGKLASSQTRVLPN